MEHLGSWLGSSELELASSFDVGLCVLAEWLHVPWTHRLTSPLDWDSCYWMSPRWSISDMGAVKHNGRHGVFLVFLAM